MKLSIVIPTRVKSQHNNQSFLVGDDWIGSQVAAVMSNTSMWNSTAIFITWDDCGCFYDHVNPLRFAKGWGVRVPMIIAGPYVKAGYTDSHPATFV